MRTLRLVRRIYAPPNSHLSSHTVLFNPYNYKNVSGVYPSTRASRHVHRITYVFPHLPASPLLQITQNPVNQANCGSSSCSCGAECVSAFDMVKNCVLTSFQLPVQCWRMQVLNGHNNMTHYYVCTLERKFVDLLLSE